jgi:predicted Zn-dependent protease
VRAADVVPELAEAARTLYRGDPVRAQAIASEYLKAHPTSVGAGLMLAKAQTARGDFQAAYRELEQVLRRDPANTDALYYFGKLCGILSQAEYRELYALAPDSSRVHQLLGESYHLQEDLPKAEEEFLKALATSPESVQLLVALGDVKRAEALYAEAITYYSRALERSPADYDANFGLGVCHLFQSSPEVAIGWFRRALEADSASTVVRLSLGMAYMRMGKAADAVPELKAAAADPALQAQAYAILGQAYQKLNLRREAEEAFRKVRQLSQNSGEGAP